MRAAAASSAVRQRHALASARSRKAVVPLVIGARRRPSKRRGGREEDYKMSMTRGVHWQNNIWRVQIYRVCWFTHAIGGLLSFYKARKTSNLEKIIQELLEMLTKSSYFSKMN